jgi:signal transduction histidine kinase/CHASE3 domain sensor protein
MGGDRTVGQLLTRAFGVLVLLIVCSGLAGVATIGVQHGTVRELSGHVLPLQLSNAHLRAVLTDAQRGLRGYLLTGDSAQLDTYYAARSSYEAAEISLSRLAAGTEVDSVSAQVARADAWWKLADLQRQAAPRSADAGRYVAEGRPLFQEFVAANASLDASLDRRAADLRERSATLGVATVVALVALTLTAALLAAFTAVRTTRGITRPLGDLVTVLDRLRHGRTDSRADVHAGPVEIRAVAGAVNTMADENERARRQEEETALLRTAVRKLGYRIRQHLVVDDAVREAVGGLAQTLHADHVLVRMAPGQTDVPPVASLRDEHADGCLAELARCRIDWLGSGDVWVSDDPAPVPELAPPDAERRALAGAGGGPAVTVALSNADELLGAVTLIRSPGEPAWTPVEVRLVESVAADLGRGLHHARLYEREQHLVARLQDLDTAKTDFMSTVSHELRTPLTSIAGYVEMLRDADAGDINAAQERMLGVISRNTRRLRELIEDMLILSKIESGEFRAARRPVDVVVLVTNAVAAVVPLAAKASVTVHTDVQGPLQLHADPDQIDRLLMNLLSNAVKFTPAEGTVTVTAHRNDGEVVITVADTGMGIPRAEQQALFARFFRASNAVRDAIPGTGLGLAIARTIVENHQGRIQVQSAEGAGTRVTVRLPAPDGPVPI